MIAYIPPSKPVKGNKVTLLKSLPNVLEDILQIVTSKSSSFVLHFNRYEKAHVSIKSGFLLLRSLTNKKKEQIRIVPLENAEIKHHHLNKQSPIEFTVSANLGNFKQSVTLKANSPQQCYKWVTALKEESGHKNSLDSLLNEFLVVDTFGKGHFGDVNLIMHRKSGSIMALKKMNMQGSENVLNIQERVILERVNMLKDEKNIPYLPKMFFAFARNETLFVVMEAYRGGNLLELLKKHKKLDEVTVRFIIAELVFTLKSLHEVGIAHRDIKPENIMLTTSGHIRLIDFGLSKQFKAIYSNQTDNDEEPPLYRRQSSLSVSCVSDLKLKKGKVSTVIQGATSACLAPASNINQQNFHDSNNFSIQPSVGPSTSKKTFPKFGGVDSPVRYMKSFAVLGTTYYQPPEMLRGLGHNLTIDWWQVGCLMFELLYGHPMFVAQTVDAVERMIMSSKTIVFPQAEAVPLSKSCLDLMESLLVREPSDRLGSVKDGHEIMKHPWFAASVGADQQPSFEAIAWDQIQTEGVIPPTILIKSEGELKSYNTESLKDPSLQQYINSLLNGTDSSEKESNSFPSLSNHTKPNSHKTEASNERKIENNKDGIKRNKRSSFIESLSVLVKKLQPKKRLSKAEKREIEKELSRIGLQYAYKKRTI